jgi:hypothetical protein
MFQQVVIGTRITNTFCQCLRCRRCQAAAGTLGPAGAGAAIIGVGIMIILTTLVVPPVLRVLYAGHPETEVSADDEASPTGRLPDL